MTGYEIDAMFAVYLKDQGLSTAQTMAVAKLCLAVERLAKATALTLPRPTIRDTFERDCA